MTQLPDTISATPATAYGPAPEGAFQAYIRSFGLMERVMQPHFARFGISGSQWAVLRTLQRAEKDDVQGLRLTDLGDRLIIRAPSVTGVVERLVRAGLVARKTSTTDLRAKFVRLTPKGHDLLQQAQAAHALQIERVLAGFSTEEQDQFRKLLLRLWEHLSGLLAEGSLPPQRNVDSDETGPRA